MKPRYWTLGLLVLLAGAAVSLRPYPPPRLVFLAVGQGDCAVFTHAGRTVLIDAGPGSLHSDSTSRVVYAKLRSLGIQEIDLVLLSHPDGDHTGGLPLLARRFPIRQVASMAHFRTHPDLLSTLSVAQIEEKRRLWLAPGSVVQWGAYRLSITSGPHLPEQSDNEGSMVVWLEGEGARAVFMGDAGFAEEEALLNSAKDVDILKAGHHGSRTSTSDPWLQVTKPEFVILSAGRANSFGHPHPEVLQRIQSHRAIALRTDTQGDLAFVVRDGRFVPAD